MVSLLKKRTPETAELRSGGPGNPVYHPWTVDRGETPELRRHRLVGPG